MNEPGADYRGTLQFGTLGQKKRYVKEPNFMIVGAARAGTTSLYHYFDSHPEIFMSKPLRPESRFFQDPEEFEKGKEYFLTRYRGATNEQAVGEKSTNYMNGDGAAQRIASVYPQMKLIFLLRDPVERVISNYWWSIKNGLETLPLKEALLREEERVSRYEGREKLLEPFSYKKRSCYLRYIRDYLKCFPRENMLFLITEELETNPVVSLNAAYEFLGVSSIRTAEKLKSNEAPRKEETAPEIISYLLGVFKSANGDLEEFLGRKITQWRR
jgi:hypothetical protein